MVAVSLLILFALDVSGFSIRQKIYQIETNLFRMGDWLIGLSHFIFLWFCLGLIWVPQTQYILMSLAASGFGLKAYLDYGAPRSLIRAIRSAWPPLILTAPFWFAAFIRISLPPNFGDEMAYHFISPHALQHLSTWQFEPGVFTMVPRLIDTWYVLCFSLMKTYVLARLSHFLILLTFLCLSYSVLKMRYGVITAVIFSFGFIAIPQALIMSATLGFVDIANCSFLALGLIFGLDFLIFESDRTRLFYALQFWTMAIATKYSGLPALAIFLLIVVWLSFRNRHIYESLVRHWRFVATIPFLAGGYWYLKNIILTGNPVYPFFLPCYRWVETCQKGKNFFGEWTEPVRLSTLPAIFDELFGFRHAYFGLLVIALVGIGRAYKYKRQQILISVAVLVALLAGELLFISHFSGFMLRYHQHLQIELLLIMAIGTGALVSLLSGRVKYLVVVFSTVLITVSYGAHLKYTYEPGYTYKDYEREYALGRTDIYSFLQHRLPSSLALLKMCDEPSDHKPFHIVTYDPDLIWYDDLFRMRIFFTNCDYVSGPISVDQPLAEVLPDATLRQLHFLLATINPCVTPNDVVAKIKSEEDLKLQMRRLNNLLVCQSHPLLTGLLYDFDANRLQPHSP
jgi:hypothetical protein